MSVSNRQIVAGIGVWLLGTGAALWHWEGRYLRPVARPNGAAQWLPHRSPVAPPVRLPTDGGSLALAAPMPLTLLNFWSPSCACSRFSETEVRSLVEAYRPRDVRFITIIECDVSASAQREARAAWWERGMPAMPVVLDAGGGIARRCGVWAAPGAVVMDHTGRVVYVGAYNAARFCDKAPTAWARQALAAAWRGQTPLHPTTPFYGCQVAGK